MTSNPPAGSPEGQVPGAPAAAICKRPGCGNILPAGERGRARQFCGDACARRYHNNARVPVLSGAAPADSSADPLAALDTVIRQAAVLTRAAREQAAALDPARVRAQIAEAEAAQRRAEAAAVTAEARAAEAAAESQALAEALDAARQDTRAAQAATAAARLEAENAVAALEQARRDAATQIAAAQAGAARYARERDDAAEAARRADAGTIRARQAETDARAETDRVRADAARERDTLREQHQAQLEAITALTAAERARAERAEQLLDTERADRRHLTSTLTAPSTPGNGNGKLPRAAGSKGDQP